jgi:hypothetical protein
MDESFDEEKWTEECLEENADALGVEEDCFIRVGGVYLGCSAWR